MSSTDRLPSALAGVSKLAVRVRDRRLAPFLDYDGTLTPIVDHPDKALLGAEMREVIRQLSERCLVAILSGRDLGNLRRMVGLDGVYYAGSHGFDIAGPEGTGVRNQVGVEFLPDLARAQTELAPSLANIRGVLLERKRFALAVHYRNVPEEKVPRVREVVNRLLDRSPRLRLAENKKVLELQPAIDWNKGKAMLWLLAILKLDRPEVLPVYIGDDLTDEDAFRALKGRGMPILAGEGSKSSAAEYALRGPTEVLEFLKRLSS